MARRRGRKGDYLITDDYTGFTTYGSKVRRDYWGDYSLKPLKRNMQEIASPLNDPAPVHVYRGPNYEASNGHELYVPISVGNTNVPTNTSNAAIQSNGYYTNVTHGRIIAGIGAMAIESTFIVS